VPDFAQQTLLLVRHLLAAGLLNFLKKILRVVREDTRGFLDRAVHINVGCET
jgi:hypothetical protein